MLRDKGFEKARRRHRRVVNIHGERLSWHQYTRRATESGRVIEKLPKRILGLLKRDFEDLATA